jgi:acetyltransferase-like isoleucine patch superfamily enzyme
MRIEKLKKKLTPAFLYYKYYYYKLIFISFYSTFYCRIFFRLLGIQLKSGSIFWGIPRVFYYPGSKISLGQNIKFRTAPASNLIGLNRKTIISTHDKKANILIGDNCGFSAVVIGARESITIGNNVMAGANVLITDFDWHSMKPNEHENGIPESKPIFIEDNVFIGYSSTILKGVSIGQNSIIGANSVVAKNIPSNVIAAGNPCKVIKSIL